MTPLDSREIDRFGHGCKIHCIGIGGCGLSGLARLLAGCGAVCRGSDDVRSPVTEALEDDGFAVSYRQAADTVADDCDLVIASAAIKPDHPELLEAHRRRIPVLSYAEALGLVQARRTGISIAGTHGKSTAAAMLCYILIECGFDPSIIVGATCPQIGGGSRVGAATIPGPGPWAGRPGILIAEACEFNRSFHNHRPVLGLINNIEEDHLDVYDSLATIVEAFSAFARRLPAAAEGGRLLIAHEGAHRHQVAGALACAVETFGFSSAADYEVLFDSTRRTVALRRAGRVLACWPNTMPGAHNALNAAAAAVLASYLGAAWPRIGAALGSFRGLDRRMQRLGRRAIAGGHVTVYDDYGHHPTEIDATLRALRALEQPARLICVFQPHQHSRTRFLLEGFARSFSSADVVIVPHIYFVRDSAIEKHRVSASDLVDRLRGRGVTAMHLYPFQAIVEQLQSICRDGDLLVVMGAGPVWQVAHEFLRKGARHPA